MYDFIFEMFDLICFLLVNFVSTWEKQERTNQLKQQYQKSRSRQEMESIREELDKTPSKPETLKSRGSILEKLRKFWVLYQRMLYVILFGTSDQARMILPTILVIVELFTAYKLPLLVGHERDWMGSLASPIALFIIWSSSIAYTGNFARCGSQFIR